MMLQFLIDRLGRKTMLLTGSTVMFVTMVSVGVIVAKFRHDWANHLNAGKFHVIRDRASFGITTDPTLSLRLGCHRPHMDLCKFPFFPVL